MAMTPDQIEREATVETIDTIKFLREKYIIGLKDLAADIEIMGHSDKWSAVYDYLSDHGYSTKYVTKIVMLIELRLLNDIYTSK